MTIKAIAVKVDMNDSAMLEAVYTVLSIEMVSIPGGIFMMGSPAGEFNRYSDETQHSAEVSAFQMSKYPVTQAQYKILMGYNPSNFQGTNLPAGLTNGDNLPVERVTWYDAVMFCNELSDVEGLTPVYVISGITKNANGNITAATVTATFTNNGYRLPTEAEWEYACRADYLNKTTETNTNPFEVGDGTKMTHGLANFYTGNPYDVAQNGDYSDPAETGNKDSTTEVGSYGANNYGLYDMHGNVLEWCWDWYDTYSGASPKDYDGPTTGSNRVLRGGSWYSLGQYLRSACRFDYGPDYWYYDVGFRVVRS